MKGYRKSETAELIECARKAESEGKSLTKVFSDFALKTGRAKGSVRNYYYRLLKEADKNANDYPALKSLKASGNVNFTKSEEDELLCLIERGIGEGKSVRRTVYEMSGGDEKLALRFQNKYRSILRKKRAASYEKEDAYKELAEKINALVGRIGKSLREENQRLKAEIKKLTVENESLKEVGSKSNLKQYFCSAPMGEKNKA